MRPYHYHYHYHHHHHQVDGESLLPIQGKWTTYCSVSVTNICENFKKKNAKINRILLSAEAVAEECIKRSGNNMQQHYSRFLTPSSLFALPAFLLIYFCPLSSLASNVLHIRNKICSHISNAEHLSLAEERETIFFSTKSCGTVPSKK